MNPLVLSLADGTTFFIGMFLALVPGLLLLHFRRGFPRPLLTVLMLAGMTLVVISATPLPIWAYVLWLLPGLAVLILGQLAKPLRPWRFGAGGLLISATAGLCLAEAPFHCLPRLTVAEGQTVYVLGDSISAGIGTNLRCWPEVLGDTTSLRVINLARAAATVEGAIEQAGRIAEPNSLVIVEIGGNDLLDRRDAATFRKQLDSLLSSLRAARHRVLLFELPLPPFHNAFGRAQRDLAARHGVTLLPKRCFTRVLGTRDGTIDALHLSQKGHNLLAEILAGVLGKSG